MSKSLTIAIAGNPNSGKTTIFNGLTGGKLQIGNWPGVTVEKKEGLIESGSSKISIVDLPGVYSLSANSEDEKVTRDFLLSGSPDLIINVIDSSNIERNLYLTTQLIEMNMPLFIVLNMYDLAKKKKIKIQIDHLQEHLGVPVIAVNGKEPSDINKLKDLLFKSAAEHPRSPLKVIYHNEIEQQIAEWDSVLKNTAEKMGANTRWISLKLLERDPWVIKTVSNSGDLTEEAVKSAEKTISSILKDDLDIVIADSKYGTIHGICKDTVIKRETKESRTEKIDAVLMHRIFGIPIFLAVMYLIFWFTISVGGAFIKFFDNFTGAIFVDGFGWLLGKINSPEWLTNILAGGAGAGIQTISTFIPIIFCMFFALSLLEDSGYMARAAFIMDKFLRGIGLPGKAFVPMLVGFGCTVPAIMGARTLENKKDRFMTIFITPFMSCGARLPIYALFGTALFPRFGGLLVFLIYLIGIVLAVVTGLLLKKTLFSGKVSHFVMELPPYHSPRIKHILIHTNNRLKGFVLRAGKFILGAVLVLSFLNTLGTDGSFGNENTENSLLAGIGKSVTPVFSPMGINQDNWPATVGLFTGMFAKESIAGTLTSLYSQNDLSGGNKKTEEDFNILTSLKEAFFSIGTGFTSIADGFLDPLGLSIMDEEKENSDNARLFNLLRERFTPAAGFAYLLFVLIYFPCFAALGAAIREMGAFYATLQAIYLTVFAWTISTLFFQIISGGSLGLITLCLGILGSFVLMFYIIGKRNNI